MTKSINLKTLNYVLNVILLEKNLHVNTAFLFYQSLRFDNIIFCWIVTQDYNKMKINILSVHKQKSSW